MDTKILGRWGETLAARYMRDHGYKITGMGYHTRFGEIDIIAEDRKYIVFVEVKLRKNDRYGRAGEFVSRAKREKIITTAGIWLQNNETNKQPRFDVVEIYAPMGIGTVCPEINHIKNAFGDDL